jgi:hypothetical protein
MGSDIHHAGFSAGGFDSRLKSAVVVPSPGVEIAKGESAVELEWTIWSNFFRNGETGQESDH